VETNFERTIKNHIERLNPEDWGMAVGSVKASPDCTSAVVKFLVQKGKEGNKLARAEESIDKQSLEAIVQKVWKIKPEIKFTVRGIRKSELAPQIRKSQDIRDYRSW